MQAESTKPNTSFDATLSAKDEMWALTRLATPLVLACLLNMGISITDVVMMSWLGTSALAAGTAASDYYSIAFHFSAGVATALSPLVSQALGARNHDEVSNLFKAGLILVLIISIPGAFLIWHSPLLLLWIGVSQEIVLLSAEYAHMMSFTFIFMLGVIACGNFLSAHQRTHVIYYVHIIALPLNAVGNYMFMFGNAYVPELGLAGAGLSSLLVAAFMFSALFAYILFHTEFRHYRIFWNIKELHRAQFLSLTKIGLPIGVSRLSELGVYLLSTVLIGIFGAEQLAAHALTLRLAGVLYAFPLGLSQATTVRVALAVGSADEVSFQRTSMVSLSIVAGITAFNSLALVFLRHPLADYFFEQQNTSGLAVTLLAFLIIAHPIHGVATVCNGILRGIKDTYIPMWTSLTAFWGVGFTSGCLLAFYGELSAVGIWIGLLIASTTFCIALLSRFWLNTGITVVQAVRNLS